jgi:hypothetical protein
MQGNVPKLGVEAEFTIRTTKWKYEKRHSGLANAAALYTLRCIEYPNDKSEI